MAWALTVVAGVGVCVGVYFALRPWPRLRYAAALLVATWTLLPWRFDDDPTHLAPAFIVLVFHGWFEPGGEAGPVMIGLALATAAVLAIYMLVASVSSILARRRLRDVDGNGG